MSYANENLRVCFGTPCEKFNAKSQVFRMNSHLLMVTAKIGHKQMEWLIIVHEFWTPVFVDRAMVNKAK